jgi:hypothetical protein
MHASTSGLPPSLLPSLYPHSWMAALSLVCLLGAGGEEIIVPEFDRFQFFFYYRCNLQARRRAWLDLDL